MRRSLVQPAAGDEDVPPTNVPVHKVSFSMGLLCCARCYSHGRLRCYAVLVLVQVDCCAVLCLCMLFMRAVYACFACIAVLV